MNRTDEKLAQLSQADLHNVWTNARKRGQDELVRRIEESGRPYLDPKGMTLDSPAGKAMTRVIYSQPAKDAGAAATEAGLPALAYIEPLIVAELGAAYVNQYEATVQAGYIVAEMMENNGFDKTSKKKPMPPGSVAKRAEFFKRKS